jgi:hypothetical protein
MAETSSLERLTASDLSLLLRDRAMATESAPQPIGETAIGRGP